MIEQAVEDLSPIVGTRPACRALGVAHATIYRRRRPPAPRPKRPRQPPARALSGEEREAVLQVLHSERFIDHSPASVVATLLDEERYLASERTMYRILAAAGENRERRNQLRHPSYAKPELLAERPNELWSWDITKLLGPRKWTYYYLYVILDVFSRYVVGWTIQYRESARVAEQLIAQAITQQGIPARPAYRSRRPRQRNDGQNRRVPDGGSRGHQDALEALHVHGQPILGGTVQNPEVPARLPGSFRLHRGCEVLRPGVLPLVQPRAQALRDRPHDTGRRAQRSGREAPRASCTRTRSRVRSTS